MAREEIIMSKTVGVPVGKVAGFIHGAVYQPYYGGGYNNATDSGQANGLKGFGRNLGQNWTGIDFVSRTWSWEPLVNGPGAVVAGHVIDVGARFIGIQKVVNRMAKLLGTKFRWRT
jgi:hypothetical protein